MEEDELVLSDVHIAHGQSCYSCAKGQSREGYNVVVSRFLFTWPHKGSRINLAPAAGDENRLDEDGDLVVQRQETRQRDVINIEHAMSTRLKDVGLQVWQGSLLLCDFLLSRPQVFSNVHALELGAGVGLVSIVMATLAKTLICTDVGDEILETCERNLKENRSLCWPGGNGKGGASVGSLPCKVLVRELDWTKDVPQLAPTDDEGIPSNAGDVERQPSSIANRWSLSDSDAQEMQEQVTVLVAADAFYDENLTDAFFRTVHGVMGRAPAKTLYIALERRLNFTLTDLDVSCPAYDHFCLCLSELALLNEERGLQYHNMQMPTDFPQYFNYSRNKYLELWKVWTSFGS